MTKNKLKNPSFLKSWAGILTIAFAFIFVLLNIAFAERGRSAAFLSRNTRGQDAINKLGQRLPAVAARYKMTKARLKSTFLNNKDLFLGPEDRLIYFCGFGAPEGMIRKTSSTDNTLALSATYPLDQTFLLHSKPGASKIIYLDFDGHLTTYSDWTQYNNGEDIDSQPLDLDNNPSNFSETERELIQNIWQRVAEDFAMYDIDVTTEDPGDAALRKTPRDQNYGVRAVISPTLLADFSNAGGVAFLESFTANIDLPIFIFSSKLGPNGEKAIAEAISHETGHSLGLHHDGKTDGTEYYSGHGDWAPIMGVGYYKPITQWSQGEYTGANNLEDDLALMQNYGPLTAVDDHGNTMEAATVLSDLSLNATGTIEERNDIDVFSFTAGLGTLSITVSPALKDVNLDISFQLLDQEGVLIAEIDQTNNTDESVSINILAGTYFIRIDGVGTGNPATGYSDYASLGQYTLTGNIPAINTCHSWDFDVDGDIDGVDLFWLTISSTGPELTGFADEFGRTNCYE